MFTQQQNRLTTHFSECTPSLSNAWLLSLAGLVSSQIRSCLSRTLQNSLQYAACLLWLTCNYLEQWALKFCLTDSAVCSSTFVCCTRLTVVLSWIACQFFLCLRGAQSSKQVKTHFSQPQLLQQVWKGRLFEVPNYLPCNQQSSQLLQNRSIIQKLVCDTKYTSFN